MKKILLLLMIAIAPFGVMAQADSLGNIPDSLSTYDDTVTDHGEAGGILANEAVMDKPNMLKDDWIYLVLGAVVIVVISSAITRSLIYNRVKEQKVIPEQPAKNTTGTKGKDTKTYTEEINRLKLDIKTLMAQLEEQQNIYTNLDRNMELYRNFDNGYFNEAFRKLVVPMNEVMENGSEKEIMENLMKIMGHFSSLIRYKISKKQPYDEANIHYLLNQKISNEKVAVDINKETPVDKVPKNIKTIINMLKQHGSKGLDDSIIAGYKIKNL